MEPRESEDQRPLDPRVKWGNQVSERLKNDRRDDTMEMRRNRDLYRNKHWTTFGSGKRPGWKLSGVLNYCAWIVDHKAAICADNKPKVSYSTPRQEDSWQSEIMTAFFNEWYYEDHLQRKIEDAGKLAGIDKACWGVPTYDPFAREGRGGAVLRVVPGMAVYLNKEATNVDDCSVLMYEYTEAYGDIIARWRHLDDKKLLRATDPEDDGNEGGGETRIQPAQSFTANGTTTHYAPYEAPQSEVQAETSNRVLVREFWTKPRGPKYDITLDALDFTVTGEVVTRPKTIEFEDGSVETLQTVITEGNIVYEVPMSTAILMQYSSSVGGLQVLDVQDAVEVVTKEVRVPLYPTGRRMVVAGGEIADDGCNPNANGKWPFFKYDANRDPTTVYGKCDIDRIASLQDCLNRIFSMVFDSAHLMANPIWRMPLNTDVADEELTNAPGAIIREDMNSLRYGKREKGPEIPAYIIPYINLIIAEIMKQAGITEMSMGGKPKGQIASETVTQFQEAANIRMRQMMRNMEQWIIDIGDYFRGIVAQYYTEERMVEVRRQTGESQHIAAIGTLLTAPMKMQAKAGSQMPTSPSARLSTVLSLMHTPAMDIPELLKNLEELGIIENETVLLKRLVKEQNDPRLRWLIPALAAPPPGGKKKQGKKNAGSSARARSANSVMARM
jgi:hypothetical protein